MSNSNSMQTGVPLAGPIPTSTLVHRKQPGAPATTVIANVISGDKRIDPLIEDALNWSPFTDAQKVLTREILGLLQQQTKLGFQEVAESAGSTGTEGIDTLTSIERLQFPGSGNKLAFDLANSDPLARRRTF